MLLLLLSLLVHFQNPEWKSGTLDGLLKLCFVKMPNYCVVIYVYVCSILAPCREIETSQISLQLSVWSLTEGYTTK
ncbi:hypothetical protein J4Q44_G00114890 [Coregonus suidteri]|uniref:Uncharacterized protein n=1 Tax=Coregonus suidteri TaxID=861788 RepID=A0AAN8R0N7_9TELE